MCRARLVSESPARVVIWLARAAEPDAWCGFGRTFPNLAVENVHVLERDQSHDLLRQRRQLVLEGFEKSQLAQLSYLRGQLLQVVLLAVQCLQPPATTSSGATVSG